MNVFAIARAPVTNAEYSVFLRETSHPFLGELEARTGREAHPVEVVSWADAVAYCRWLSLATGRIYRLPDEREWEKTARGTNGRRWPWGDADDAGRANVRESSRGSTTPVGSIASGATPEGVVDLIGNVREWTNSWVEGARVLRGGSYLDALADCAPARRLHADASLRGIGFRVVRGMTGR